MAFLSFFAGALADANVCRRVDLVTTGNATRPCGTGAVDDVVDWLVASFDSFRRIGDSPGLGMSTNDFFDEDDDDDDDDNCSVSIVSFNSADLFAATALSSLAVGCDGRRAPDDLAFDLVGKVSAAISCSEECSYILPADVFLTSSSLVDDF